MIRSCFDVTEASSASGTLRPAAGPVVTSPRPVASSAERRTMTTPPTLPTPEALDAFSLKLNDVNEELDALVRPVFEAINYEGEQTVTFADIGALVVFAHNIRFQAEGIDTMASRIDESAKDDLDVIREQGRKINVPSFDRLGFPPTDEDVIKRLTAGVS
jgi:hypothetical protein